MTKRTLVVTLNGTTRNPWSVMGLRANPFPQSGQAEFDRGERLLAKLDGEPIASEDDLRGRLQGFHPAFIEGCVRRYQPGRRVRFTVEWEEGDG